jgi:multiple sugar transport system ATP-binding protein
MRDGVIQQVGKPQEVYDNPTNLFVAKFLGTPPINVFNGEVKGGKLYIGNECVLDVAGVADQPVTVGIRPEGFIPSETGAMTCNLTNLEIMGRDASVVATHSASCNPTVRSIIDGDCKIDTPSATVRYNLKPHKVFLFSKLNEKRIEVAAQNNDDFMTAALKRKYSKR